MRIIGTLTKWNDDRGFGFIAPAQGGSEIFVHVSTFPKDGQRPKVGERLSFEVETDKNGKKHATNLVCLGRQVQHASRQHAPAHRHEKRSFFGRFVQLALVISLVTYGYVEYSRRAAPRSAVVAQPIEQPSSAVFVTPQPVEKPSSAVFQCDGRTYCSQMTSCDEATFFLKNCPSVKMDGNHDGVPCQQQWCIGISKHRVD